MKFLSVTLASLGLASAASVSNKQKVSYDDWKVFRVNGASNTAKFQEVAKKLQLDVWKGKLSSGDVVDVSVAPEQLSAFEASTKNFETKIMHENLGASIADEETFSVYAAGAAPNATWFNSYHALAEHYQWISDLAAAYPKNSEVISAGKSLEGRDIKGIHIWGSGGKGSQKAVVWHSTVHAREWITTMVNEYAAYQLLSSTDPTTAAFKNKYDFYIFPVVNPDGFYFSQNSNRLWRKNRQSNPAGSSCIGRDINRNWPHKSWSQAQGASTSPCDEDYKGPSAGDGVETKALKAQLDGLAAGKGIQLYMDIHAYSQLWLYPYGYTCSGVLPNSATYASLTQGAIAAVKAVHGTTFTGGPICKTIYQVSGDSVDYALENAKAKYSMTVELRDTGRYGFVLPANQILPSSEEMWAGLAYMLKNMT